MSVEDRARKWREIRNLSDDKIQINLSQHIWNPETEEIAERELRSRDQQRTLDVAKNTADATQKLVMATRYLVRATVALVIITAYTGILQPFCKDRKNTDVYIKSLKQNLSATYSKIQQNIKMIEGNKEILDKRVSVLNGLYILEKPNMNEIVKYVNDTNAVSLMNVLSAVCINSLNQKIKERNNIYENIILNHDSISIPQLILPKEALIKKTSAECLAVLEKIQRALDLIHEYNVETQIKQL